MRAKTKSAEPKGSTAQKTQINCRVSPEAYAEMDEIADSLGIRPGSIGSIFLKDRMDLYKAGWTLDNRQIKGLLLTVAALSKESLDFLENFLRDRVVQPQRGNKVPQKGI